MAGTKIDFYTTNTAGVDDEVISIHGKRPHVGRPQAITAEIDRNFRPVKLEARLR